MRLDVVLVAIVCWGLALFLPKVAGRSLSPVGVVFANALGYLVCLPALYRFLDPADLRLRRDHLWGMLIGVLFVGGNLAYFKLVAEGQLTRAAPLTSLYVAVPVVLGAIVLRERLAPAQWLGVALAVVAAALLASERQSAGG